MRFSQLWFRYIHASVSEEQHIYGWQYFVKNIGFVYEFTFIILTMMCKLTLIEMKTSFICHVIMKGYEIESLRIVNRVV